MKYVSCTVIGGGKFNVAKAATREDISHRLPFREDIANYFGVNSTPLETGVRRKEGNPLLCETD